VPGGTPYITPGMLLSRPAGISWTVIPRLTASTSEQMAQLAQVCWTATSVVDTYCRQSLRATAATETITGPGRPRVAVDRNNGIGTLLTRRWPITEVVAVQVSPVRAFPPKWSLVPADQCFIRHPVDNSAGPAPATRPSGGAAIDVAPGYIIWDYGRGGQRILVSYVSTWPHTSLTADAAADASEIAVDDVTGWAGVTGFAYDSLTEGVTVTTAVADAPVQLPGVAGTVQAGPGTLTLSGPLAQAHTAGTVVSALPPIVLRAAALAASVEALEGINAIAIQSLSGQIAGGTGALATEVELLLDDFRVVM
jgi:autotransporter-associated beta strand protein